MRIRLTRDSVAMGDDVYAPHEEWLDLPDGATVAEAVTAVLRRRYLAVIQGGLATWVVTAGGRPFAVVAQQWEEPRWIDDGPAPAEIHFRYLQQRDPDEVLAELGT